MGKLTGSFWQFESSILAQSLGFSLSLENLTVDKDRAKKNHTMVQKTADVCARFQINADGHYSSGNYLFGYHHIL